MAKIVEEEQRLGALHDQIVDAHGDKVDADRVVQAASRSAILSLVPTPSLAATRIGSRKARRAFRSNSAAEAAEIRIGSAPAGRWHSGLMQLDQRIAGIDVDAGVGIGERLR